MRLRPVVNSERRGIELYPWISTAGNVTSANVRTNALKVLRQPCQDLFIVVQKESNLISPLSATRRSFRHP